MSELFEKSLRTLELPRVLEMLSAQAVSDEAKRRCLALRPETDVEDVERLQDETEAARRMMALRGSPGFSGVKPVREILDRADLGETLGVCLDTCHVHDAGYDLVGDLDGVLTEFDRIIGLNRLRAVHLNDSMNPRGARKDRHQKLGQGCIGPEALKRVVTHPALQGLPMVLETPNELPGYAEEIRLMRQWMREEGL